MMENPNLMDAANFGGPQSPIGENMMIMIIVMMLIAYDYDDDDSHFDGVELLDLNLNSGDVVVVEVLHLLQLILQPDILISI